MKQVKNENSAIALKYPENADAPFITAKSRGALAKKMLEIAKENNVPIVKNEIATEILTAEEIGSSIPEETWEIIAKIFTFLIEKNGNL